MLQNVGFGVFYMLVKGVKSPKLGFLKGLAAKMC